VAMLNLHIHYFHMISRATHSTQLHETKFDYICLRTALWSNIKEMDH
jgi:hypothetical protein